MLEPEKKALPINPSNIKKIAVLGPQANKVELGDYSGEVEANLKISPLTGIQNYIKQKGLNTEVAFSSGGNTERKNDFYSFIGFTTVLKDGAAKKYDATKYDAYAKGLITSARFGQSSVRGIKDGDWTSYNGVDITNLDSIKFNMNVTENGGSIEVRVGSITGNVIASKKIEAVQQAGSFRGFGRSVTIPSKINTLGITGQQNLFFVFREPEAPATDKETSRSCSFFRCCLNFCWYQ